MGYDLTIQSPALYQTRRSHQERPMGHFVPSNKVMAQSGGNEDSTVAKLSLRSVLAGMMTVNGLGRTDVIQDLMVRRLSYHTLRYV